MQEHRAPWIFSGIGVACLIAAYLIHRSRAETFVERPQASGDVGVMHVYAQRPNGPVLLRAGRPVEYERPQHLSFQWHANGTGPRFVRISIEGKQERIPRVMHEEKLQAPAEYYALEYVLELRDDAPDDLELIVALEAPHTRSYEVRYPIRLLGSSKRAL